MRIADRRFMCYNYMMERRGVYRKGSQGHARNVSSYRLSRQNFKKWRVPLTGLLALLFVFGAAPVVGDEFQVSVLTDPETTQAISEKPEEAKKIFLDTVNTITKKCEEFKIKECPEFGRELLARVAKASAAELKSQYVNVLEFEKRFGDAVSAGVCRYEVPKVTAQLRSVEEQLETYGQQFAGAFESPQFERLLTLASALQEELAAFVDSCKTR